MHTKRTRNCYFHAQIVKFGLDYNTFEMILGQIGGKGNTLGAFSPMPPPPLVLPLTLAWISLSIGLTLYSKCSVNMLQTTGLENTQVLNILFL